MNLSKFAFNQKIRAEVWQMLADLTSTGMEMGRALELVSNIYRRRSKRVAAIVDDLRKSLSNDSFSEVVRKYIPESEALIFVKFGKVNDADLFRAAARIARVEAEIRKAILSAIFKPAFILVLMLVLLFFLGNDFYPTLMMVSPMENWPRSWQIIATIAMWVARNPFALLGIIAVIYGIYKVVQRNYVGPFRSKLDKIPPFSLYRLSAGATFIFVILENAAVGNAINSNLLKSLSKNASPYARSRIMKIAKNVASMNIGKATIVAGQDFPDAELNAVLDAYAEQKEWVDKFRSYAEAWLQRLEEKVKTTVAVMNMVLLIIAAGLIAVIGRTIFGVVNLIS